MPAHLAFEDDVEGVSLRSLSDDGVLVLVLDLRNTKHSAHNSLITPITYILKYMYLKK